MPDTQIENLAINAPLGRGSSAVACAIEMGDYRTAVEFLERGRGLVWAGLNRYRSPLGTLRVASRELADRYESLSQQLQQLAVSNDRILNFNTELRQKDFDREMEHLHRTSEEWDSVVAEIRAVDGFSDFLKVMPFDQLQKAASNGPVIIVNISKHRCDAIILRDGSTPVVVPLPELAHARVFEEGYKLYHSLTKLHTRQERVDLSRKWEDFLLWVKQWFETNNDEPVYSISAAHQARSDIKDVLRFLWTSIVSPIVDKLQELSIQPQSRIWWCPTSLLCHLPLHAAGPYEEGQLDLPDIFVSSYLLTLSSSEALRPKHPDSSGSASSKSGMLVIACPGEVESDSFLENVEEEVREIIDSWPPEFHESSTVLIGEEANRNNTLSQLPHHSWVHFTCHGEQNRKPLESSFMLHDGQRLTLIDLMNANVRNAELAFLSACNTATGDMNGAHDEGLHLAAAMQYCGFRSVVGTLWPMADVDGPDVARDFYQYLLNEGKGDYRCSAAALHDAVQKMRERDVPIDRWINFVHYGA